MQETLFNNLYLCFQFLNQFFNHYFGYNQELLETISYSRLKYLIESRGVNIHYRNEITPLHSACITPMDMKERFYLLLSHGSDVNAQADEQAFFNTPLHLLIANENVKAARELIEVANQLQITVDFNKQEKNGCTILCMAAKFHLESLAVYLVENREEFSIDINKPDNDGMTPLHYAYALGQQKLVDALIKSGANQKAQNNLNEIPLNTLQYSADQVNKMLSSIEIDPERDENAKLNHFHDRNLQSHLLVMLGPIPLPIQIDSKKSEAEKLEILNADIIDSYRMVQERKLMTMNEEDKNFIRQQLDDLTGSSLLERIQSEKLKMLRNSNSQKNISIMESRSTLHHSVKESKNKDVNDPPHIENKKFN